MLTCMVCDDALSTDIPAEDVWRNRRGFLEVTWGGLNGLIYAVITWLGGI